MGKELDAHCKAHQTEHPKLTLTAMNNCLEILSAGDRIEGKDKLTCDQGLTGLLKDIHDRIDAAVADSYGWPISLTSDEILHYLVALNRERAAEEAQVLVRWLRPNYQIPEGKAVEAKGEQAELAIGLAASTAKTP